MTPRSGDDPVPTADKKPVSQGGGPSAVEVLS
jgi:hypothetical protein